MIKVFYPHGGKHFLLHWSSYDERGNVILAKTERGVQEVAVRLFQQHWHAEIQSFWEIDIVAPSSQMQQQAEEADLQKEISYLHFEIVDRLRDLLEAGETLPAIFQTCTSYELEKQDEEHIDKNDEYCSKRHYCCKNCHSTIKSSLSKEELFHKYHQAWREQFPEDTYDDPKLVESKAEPAQEDGKELFYADTSSFGDHGQGVELKQFDPENPVFNNNLFWFYKIKELDHSSLSSLLEQKRNLRKEEEKEEYKKNEALRQKEEQRKREAVLTIFKKEPNQ
jgi:hypothetical protein